MTGKDTWRIAGLDVHVLVSSHSTAGRYTISHVEAAAGEGAPLHTHQYEDGFFYILQGVFQFQIAKENVLATEGTSVFIPRGTPYSLRSQAGGTGRLLVVTVPGGMDLLIRDLGELARRGGALNRDLLAPVLEKHGVVPFEDGGGGETM